MVDQGQKREVGDRTRGSAKGLGKVLQRVTKLGRKYHDLESDLIRFNKIAIPNNKFQMAKWTRKPLAYRESNNFLIYRVETGDVMAVASQRLYCGLQLKMVASCTGLPATFLTTGNSL